MTIEINKEWTDDQIVDGRPVIPSNWDMGGIKGKMLELMEPDINTWFPSRIVIDKRFYNPLVAPRYIFMGEDAFLSNFYPTFYPKKSVEHLYQAAKVKDGEEFDFMRQQILDAETPYIAKKLGKAVPIRKDWEQIKEQVMAELIIEKFYMNKGLKKKLLETGTDYLVEGTYWHDREWGVCVRKDCPKCQGKIGKNMLGNILMEVRMVLQEMEGK